VSNVLQSVRRYIESSVLPAARKEAERIQDPNKPVAGLLEAADEMLGRDFFNAEQLKPVNQIGACLDAWVEGIETLLGHRQAGATPKVNAVVTEILAGIRQALESLEQRVPPLSWTSSDIAPLVGEAMDAKWATCAEALLHENAVGAIKTALRVFSLRKQAVEALIELAWQRRSSGERGLNAPGRSNGTPRLADFFTTPLCASLESTNALDSVSARDLRQSLIKPVLFGTVLSIREVKPELADVRAVEERLVQNLGQLAAEMKRFLRDIENHGWEVFRNGLAEHQATNEHPYYRSICEIWRLAEPKIDLSKSRKYAAPLDVTVAQQVSSSCVPQLLTHNCEMSLREANVDEDFRHITGEWLQILRLRYGFCLEAISRYGKYVAATDEYVKRMGFEFSDLWLDKSWYVSYQHSLAEWRTQAGPQKDTMERRTYEANAAKAGSLRKLLESVSDRLRQRMRSVTDSEVGIRMAELHGGTSSRIDLILHGLPLVDSEAVRQGLGRCLTLMETLIQNMDQCSAGLPEKERHTVTDTLEGCRSEIQAFREGALN
jgi:hypothetical protein